MQSSQVRRCQLAQALQPLHRLQARIQALTSIQDQQVDRQLQAREHQHIPMPQYLYHAFVKPKQRDPFRLLTAMQASPLLNGSLQASSSTFLLLSL